MFGRTPLTPEQKILKDRQKAERDRERAAHRERQAEAHRQYIASLPYFTVRETREVTVQAKDMNDAIALASAAFKEGQSNDHSIKWSKPFGVDGDTVDAIKTVNIKAVENPDYEPAQ